MKVYTVTEFNREIKAYLEQGVTTVVVQGEVIGFRKAKERLVYFELKDRESRVLCFMMVWDLKVPLEDGAEIRVYGLPSLFVRSGGFHLRVQEIELVGEGALQKALEMTKVKLEKEGLFALERKRPLPAFPRNIGLITSPDAAAKTDVLRILENRWSGLHISFFPTAVQGVGAAKQLIGGINYFNEQGGVEVIIITRGGGSLEDLQAFNSEELARAIFASKIPLVCGVGHERDWTIADLVADRRATTPTNAAELVVPDKQEINRQIDELTIRLERGLKDVISRYQQKINEQVNILSRLIKDHLVRVSDLLYKFKYSFDHYQEKLKQLNQDVIAKKRLLINLNPEHLLKRGYSITYSLTSGNIISDKKTTKINEKIKTKLAKGEIISQIKKLN